jgi:putative transposase
MSRCFLVLQCGDLDLKSLPALAFCEMATRTNHCSPAARAFAVSWFTTMTRSARLVSPECPHHVTQRGNRRQEVFRDDYDRRKFIDLLRQYIARHHVEVWSYVLMTNHIHLIAVPQTPTSLSSAMRDCLSDYALFFNRRYGYVGHLWQQRFYSSMLGWDHVWTAVRYVERNPVRGRMVDRAENYCWSSAAFHCGIRRTDPLVSPTSPLVGAIPNWSEWLREDECEAEIDRLRRNTRMGRATVTAERIKTKQKRRKK